MRRISWILLLTFVAVPVASAERPPPDVPLPSLNERFDGIQADLEAIRALVGKLKGKAKVSSEAKVRLERALTELEDLEQDVKAPPPCPQCAICPPVQPCPACAPCPQLVCPPERPCPACPTVGPSGPPTVLAISNGMSNLCLGVRERGGRRDTAGAEVEVTQCLGGDREEVLDHKWTMVPAADGFSFLKNQASGLCLGVQGVDQAGEGAAVEIYHCSADGADRRHDNQWRVVEGRHGAVEIQNRVSGLCLSVQGADRHAHGARVQLDKCQPQKGDRGRDSRWNLVPFASLIPVPVERPTPPVVVPVVREPTPMSANEFAAILQSINTQSFDNEKMRVLNMALSGKPVSVAQVKELIALFAFSSEKLEVVRKMNPTIVDKEKRFTLFEVFTFDSDKAALEAIIK